MRWLLALIVSLLLGASALSPGCASTPPAMAGHGHQAPMGGCGHHEGMAASCVGCGLALPDQPTPAVPLALARRAPEASVHAAMTLGAGPDLADPPPRVFG